MGDVVYTYYCILASTDPALPVCWLSPYKNIGMHQHILHTKHTCFTLSMLSESDSSVVFSDSAG